MRLIIIICEHPSSSPCSDIHDHFVYENQRWRLLRGYTDRVLLADHYMWSDATGKHKATREGTKLPATRRWSWLDADWSVDRRTPGGVDKDGWQYAQGIAGYLQNFIDASEL